MYTLRNDGGTTPMMFDPEKPVDSVLNSGLWVIGTADEVRDQYVEQWRKLPAEYVVLIYHYAQQPADSERGQQGNLVSARCGVEAEAKHQMQKDGRDGKCRDDCGLAVNKIGGRVLAQLALRALSRAVGGQVFRSGIH